MDVRHGAKSLNKAASRKRSHSMSLSQDEDILDLNDTVEMESPVKRTRVSDDTREQEGIVTSATHNASSERNGFKLAEGSTFEDRVPFKKKSTNSEEKWSLETEIYENEDEWLNNDNYFENLVKDKKDDNQKGNISKDHSMTLPLSPTQQNFDESDAVPITSETPQAGTSRTNPKPCPPQKILSVQRDTEAIASILGTTNMENVYKKLAEKRSNPNRLEVVTNEVLEEEMKQAETQHEEQGEMEKLLGDVEKVIKKMKERLPSKTPDPNIVYTMLESNMDKPNRVDVVLIQLCQGASSKSSKPNESTGTAAPSPKPGSLDVFGEVELIMKRYPKANADEVFAMLEARQGEPNRVKIVIDLLSEDEVFARLEARESSTKGGGSGEPNNHTSQSAGLSNKKDVLSKQDSDLANDPLFQDVQIISKIFPDRDQNEIYAFLESVHGNPNRIQHVAKILLGQEGGQSQGESQTLHRPESPPCGKQANGKQPVKSSHKPEPMEISTVVDETTPLSKLQKDVETMQVIFPDSDPNFLFEKLEEMTGDPERVNNLAARMFEDKTYPKFKERLERDKKEQHRKKLMELDFNMDDFLQMFPDPTEHFYDETKPITESYKTHSIIHLKNLFPMLHEHFIKKRFTEHQSHLLTTMRELEEIATNYFTDHRGRKKKRFRRTPRDLEDMPKDADEYFYRECYFIRNEQNIGEHLEQVKQRRKKRFEEAKERKELQECGCCFDDEVLMEDVIACPEGHLFCKECVRRSAEEIIGQGRVDFACLTECQSEFDTNILQQVLTSKMFSLLLRKIQEEEIKKADIADLVMCPFCPFATIMPDEEDKVFRCLNSDCLKESCRLCKELNHVPLRCEEVEKKKETDYRTYIENKMTEAMIRTCWKCKKRFYKTEGCNKMTCTCGASMCYLCREPITDYNHFQNCTGSADAFAIHREEIERAAEEAKAKYLEEHPDATDVDLKYDPLQELREGKAVGAAYRTEQAPQQQPGMFGGVQQQPGLFGGVQQQPGLFGGVQQQPGLFGGVQQQPGLFVGVQQQPGLFGGVQQQPGLFGGVQQQPGLFGGVQQQRGMMGAVQLAFPPFNYNEHNEDSDDDEDEDWNEDEDDEYY